MNIHWIIYRHVKVVYKFSTTYSTHFSINFGAKQEIILVIILVLGYYNQCIQNVAFNSKYRVSHKSVGLKLWSEKTTTVIKDTMKMNSQCYSKHKIIHTGNTLIPYDRMVQNYRYWIRSQDYIVKYRVFYYHSTLYTECSINNCNTC